MTDQYKMQNPKEQYSKLDIPPQRQAEPGLDAKLEPQADHGQNTYKGLGRLKERRAVITGADSGIGRAVAIAFAREGADVVLNYLPAEEVDAKETARLCEETGQKVISVPGDISDEKFCYELIETASKELGGIDILVNNAGKQVYVESIEDLTTEQL